MTTAVLPAAQRRSTCGRGRSCATSTVGRSCPHALVFRILEDRRAAPAATAAVRRARARRDALHRDPPGVRALVQAAPPRAGLPRGPAGAERRSPRPPHAEA